MVDNRVMSVERRAEIEKLFKMGYSYAQIGKMFGVTRQAVWELLNKGGRVKQVLPFVYVDGLRFVLRKNGYYGARLNGKEASLHCYLYEKEHGAIPKGYHVHHIDSNRGNNNINNLQLCLEQLVGLS